MNDLFNFKRLFFVLLTALTLFFSGPKIGHATIQITEGYNGEKTERSLESLRDLDYQTWQIVVYPINEKNEGKTILRIVGFPGTLRLDRPAKLKVKSGIKSWILEDITLQNEQLANDSREAAAEFNLEPLLLELKNNRPLRFSLAGAFNELPIPPYLVKEWRTLIGKDFSIKSEENK
ncbi:MULTISPECIES: DUF3122 domain-containing protein [Prochlorococcus]|uniref:DUF3122 domain-containing protein n=1 Tax=Prochlorococcus TaxID=1218 RepID=UPI000533A34A|nr:MULTISPECIES: DUF3122 domain-containing protein [Prochlorococcus]KGG12025.1 hypothetical protein EV05_1228 [Prochlorococcus sp. MIT 0601]